MFEEENDNKIYRLIITNGYDKNREYAKFTEQIYSKTDFLWKESISGSYSTANKEFFEKTGKKFDITMYSGDIYTIEMREVQLDN